MQNQKLLLRAAQAIRSQLESTRTKSTHFELPEADWNHCQSVIRLMRRAHLQGWHNAAQALRRGLDYPLRACGERLLEVTRQISAAERPSGLASVRDIFGDLGALVDEFENVSFDLPEQMLSVTTSPITLEDIDLGPFEIRLSWAQIGQPHPYGVVATEPNPSRACDGTTHPHVRDEMLCEGDGRIPIEQALRAGRLLDFFQIVKGILHTYNPGSAYVSLSEWDGVACCDCGGSVDPDDVLECERCQSSLCPICSINCGRCDALCCQECTANCSGCRQKVCDRCTAECPDCSHFFCTECLEDSARCRGCEEKQHAATFDRDETTPVQAQATAPPAAGEAAEESAAAAAAV
jgi:hypothetical protein